MELQRLNYAELASSDREIQQAADRQLYTALSQLGFAKITNHPIARPVIEELFSWTQRFFALPLEHKRKAAHPAQPNPHRGWSCIGQEKLSVIRQNKAVLDLKESFDMGPDDDELYPNIWTDEHALPGFREFMSDFYQRCDALHQQLLVAIARSMHLPESSFTPLCARNSSELRLNHYPAVKPDELSDFGTITLLFQDSVGGLEVEDQAEPGRYLAVEPADCADIIVNVGDCLQRWTNDRLRSANHRVTLPRGSLDVESDGDSGLVDSRYSIAYFGKPSRDETVRTLTALLRPGEEAKYKDEITAWQFNQLRLLQTY
ncbi:hypothetical protein ASPVEDRAFT_80633 [Aspergillus versicolor CBS 583.65]|uniref:Fe2OG dioxygenase domain-containing protein n=1 Tax=Aspergillus versicolor CBS 583.65 TaxID=1036611 RepID=A0A1L9PBU7_ASPVE|nr:uncharacterized protein ASPVEDRAFT_80633 [Aspergillus versicolor CBS 583.65]OJI99007.1 hypothetical protein ASPVEDRAFT_80633 [Aspergillus versicolor CBS 583.65]